MPAGRPEEGKKYQLRVPEAHLDELARLADADTAAEKARRKPAAEGRATAPRVTTVAMLVRDAIAEYLERRREQADAAPLHK